MVLRKMAAATAWLLVAMFGPAYAGDTPHWVHYRLLNKTASLPKKILIIPASIRMYEVTAGGVKEEVPDWSAEASKNVLKATAAAFAAKGGTQEVPMPSLSAAERALVDEHMALYKLVANSMPNRLMMHKIRRFDYGIGPGLASVLARSGADALVMVHGRDYASTAGRKTKAVLGKIPIVNIFTGGEVQLGHSFVHIGVIDLKTGDLLWMNSEYREGTSNMREYDDVEDQMAALFKWYPGIEEYREYYVEE